MKKKIIGLISRHSSEQLWWVEAALLRPKDLLYNWLQTPIKYCWSLYCRSPKRADKVLGIFPLLKLSDKLATDYSRFRSSDHCGLTPHFYANWSRWSTNRAAAVNTIARAVIPSVLHPCILVAWARLWVPHPRVETAFDVPEFLPAWAFGAPHAAVDPTYLDPDRQPRTPFGPAA